MGNEIDNEKVINAPIVMRVKKVPEGTRVFELGTSLFSRDFYFERDRAFEYKGMRMKEYTSKEIKYTYLVIEAELISVDSFYEEVDEIGEDINEGISNYITNYIGDEGNFIQLNAVGLNAGGVLNEDKNVKEIFANFEFYNNHPLSKNLEVNNYNINIVNSRISNTSMYSRLKDIHYDNEYGAFKGMDSNSESADGVTVGNLQDELLRGHCVSVIAYSHKGNMVKNEVKSPAVYLQHTIIHEMFHNILYSTNYFKSHPMFQGKEKYRDVATKYFNNNKKTLSGILKSDYAEQDEVEFMAEAFAAKYSTSSKIRDEFKSKLPMLDRFIDLLFDDVAPADVENIEINAVNVKDAETTKNSVKISFDHASDNLSVKKYDIHINGEYNKEEIVTVGENELLTVSPEGKVETIVDGLDEAKEYSVQIFTVDEAYNYSDGSEIKIFNIPDKTSPILIDKMVGQSLSSEANVINWNQPTDNVEVERMEVYRTGSSSEDGLAIPSVGIKYELPGDSTYFLDRSVKKGVTYNYSIVAFDKAGNSSAQSNVVSVKSSDSDNEPQNVDKIKNQMNPGNATLNLFDLFPIENIVNFRVIGFHAGIFDEVFSWENYGGYETPPNLIDVELYPGLLHQFVVVPLDEVGNILGDESRIITVIAPPYFPAELVASEIKTNEITLSWRNDNDIERIPETVVYEVYRDGDEITDPNIEEVDGRLTFTDTNLEVLTSYNYEIITRVGSNNSSLPSSINVTTRSHAPWGLEATGVKKSSIKLQWVNHYKDSVTVEQDIYRDGIPVHSNIGNVSEFTDIDLKSARTYSYKIVARRGNEVAASSTITVTTAPSLPILDVAEVTKSSIKIRWINESPPDDDLVNVSYEIYRDGEVIEILGNVSEFTDTGLESATDHRYCVVATAGEISQQSNVVRGTTCPRVPSNLEAIAVRESSIELRWTNNQINSRDPGTDIYTEIHSDIYRDGKRIDSKSNNEDVGRFTDTGLTSGETYSYKVVARVGGTVTPAESASDTITVATHSSLNAPSDLEATEVTESSVKIKWTNHYKDSRSVKQDIYRDNVRIRYDIGNVSEFTDTGLDSALIYEYKVVARRGDEEGISNIISVTTLPMAPSSLVVTEIAESSIQIEWKNNNESSKRVENDIYRDGNKIGSVGGDVTEFTDTKLASAKLYTYQIIARTEEAAAGSEIIEQQTLPKRPTYLKSTDITVSSISLSWTDYQTEWGGYYPKKSFKIYRDNVLIDTVGDGVKSYTDYEVKSGMTYSYYVVLSYAGMDSPPSDRLDVTTKEQYNLRTIRIMSSHSPLFGEDSRSSLNMDSLMYRDNYKISVNPVYNPDSRDNIKFNIKYDRPIFSDPYVANNVRHGTILRGPLDHYDSLYIADPTGAIDDFEVVIECYNDK